MSLWPNYCNLKATPYFMKFNLVGLLLLLNAYLNAQPTGDDGGVYIKKLYNNQLQEIDIEKDSNLKVRTFDLEFVRGNRYKVKGESFGFQKESGRGLRMLGERSALYLSADEFFQRIYLIYKTDTMIVDVLGIPIAFHPHMDMDSLVIQPGHFKYDCQLRSSRSYIRANVDFEKRHEFHGLTPRTFAKFGEKGHIAFETKIDLSFLDEKNLPDTYFFSRARYYIHKSQMNAAFVEISKGIEKGGGEKNCEALFLLNDAYKKLENYTQAIESISMIIEKKCSMDGEELNSAYDLVGYYNERSQLYIKNNQLQKALEDYNRVVELSPKVLYYHNERALFKMNLLENPKEAIQDLNHTIDALPESRFTPCMGYTKRYSETYFVLGLAEYKDQQHEKAFGHWLKSMEFGHSGGYFFEKVILHLDSIILKHPKEAELYLARAIALQGLGYNIGKKRWKDCLNNSLEDINKAEELGVEDYRIDLYRAKAYFELRDYSKALEEVNLSIAKNELYPRTYSLRNLLKRRLGMIEYSEELDPDVDKSQTLCKSWRFEK